MSIWDIYPQENITDFRDLRIIHMGSDLPSVSEYIKLCESDIEEIYTFLRGNYTNGDNNSIYSRDLLEWYIKDSILLGIRKEKKLVGFICGTDCVLNWFGKCISIVYVNFLCIDRKNRKRKLTKDLIDCLWYEKLSMVDAALFSVEMDIPRSFSSTLYYAYPINVDNLLESEYFELPTTNVERINYIKMLKKRYKCKVGSSGLREVKESDITSIYDGLMKFNNGRLHIETTIDKLRGMLRGPFDMYCTSDYSDFVSVYYTTEINETGKSTILGHVYIYYKKEMYDESCEVLNSLRNNASLKCDMLIFPDAFGIFPDALHFNTLKHHLFQHTSMKIGDNLISSF
jgi:hypothetical protein